MIRSAHPSEETAIRSMLKRTYQDSQAFNDYFFTHIWRPENTVVYVEDDMPCACAQTIPFRMRIGEESYPAVMDYGAAVLPSHQGQGLLKRMNLEGAAALVERGFAQRVCFTNLKATRPWQSIGYQAAFPMTFDRLDRLPGKTPSIRLATLKDAAHQIRGLDALYNRRFAAYARVDRSPLDWLHILAEYALDGGTALLEGPDGLIEGYCVYRQMEEAPLLMECAALDAEMEAALCQAVLQLLDAPYGIRHLPATAGTLERAVATGATARIATGGMPDIPYEKGYLNLFHQ